MGSRLCFPFDFLKPIIYQSNGAYSNKLFLPKDFVQRFGNLLPDEVIVKMLDGEEVNLNFERDEGVFIGMQNVLEKCCAKQLQFLLFKYHGGFKFSLYVLDTHHVLIPRSGLHVDFESMLIKVFLKLSSKWRCLKLPDDFLLKFGPNVGRQITFQLNNGKLLEGSFETEIGIIRGMQEVYKLYSMSIFNIMVFTYIGHDVFVVKAFGKNCVEKTIRRDDEPYFEIEIKPSHLQSYDFGVTIPSKFQAITNTFDNLVTIYVSHGTLKWNVLVKRRPNRVELHTGRFRMWNDLKLEVGDICVFYRAGSDKNFDLDVYKHDV